MSTISSEHTIFEHVDVLVVGAGLTGIGMGYHLTTKQPGRTFAIVEARDAIGGTWDLFRYPGIRSDADLHTFGFGFKPWTRDNAIADAHEILDYLHEVIEENDLSRHLYLGFKVLSADFSSADGRWTVTLQRAHDGSQSQVSCNVLFSAAGYYDYDQGYTPDFAGRDDFQGQVVHPQHWPKDLDYTGKKVVVIGSGATAVTLIPALAESAGHVTMLQRSPSYVLPIPRQDPIANTLRDRLPSALAYKITRAINVNKLHLLYKGSQKFPKQARALLRKVSASALPDGFDVDRHFNPAYNPWDQRMCMVPNGDMFKAISRGAASVVTDRVVRFTEHGILLESGDELDADIIVTATGLNMVPIGLMQLAVDGAAVALNDHVVYKGVMISDVPNFAFVVGYTNAAWTLKAELAADYVCRLLAHMDRYGYTTVTPVVDDPTLTLKPYVEMESGYLRRAMHLFPKQGSHGSWAADQDYRKDRTLLGTVADPALQFARVTHAAASRMEVPA